MTNAAMMNRTSSLLLLCFLLAAVAAPAQRRRPPAPRHPARPAPIVRTDTTIKATTLEVYQQYEPELKPIMKPELTPSLLPPPATRTQQHYEVPQQTLYYSYRALPLRPLALGKDTAAVPPANYALLAGGNLSTLLGEVGIGSLHGRNWKSAIQARYIAQEGNIKNQVFRSFGLKADGSLNKADHIWEGGVDVRRNVFGAYGYDHDAVNYQFDQVRRRYTAVGISLGAQNATLAWQGLRYHPQVSFSYYRGTGFESEQSVVVKLPVSKQIDSNLSVGIAVNAWITRSDDRRDSWGNNIFQLAPQVSYRRQRFSGRLGFYPTIAESGTHLLPDIAAQYGFGRDVTISAGWQASFVQNTIQQLTTANPYYLAEWSGAPGPLQTRYDDAYAALAIALGRHLSITARGGWNQWKSLPLFMNSPSNDGRDFFVSYDEQVQAIVWGAGVRYAIGEDIALSAEGTWFNYYKHRFDHVYHEPAVRLKGQASWRAIPPLLVTAYAEVLDQIWGKDNTLPTQPDVKLKGVFDFGIAAEYTVIDRLDLLLRAENLLGRKNERWLGYPSFGFNIYGGARFRF
jgi:hypothetical protein